MFVLLIEYSTVFQVEMFIIISAVSELLKRKTQSKPIYICSDCQASLKVLLSYKISSMLVKLKSNWTLETLWSYRDRRGAIS